MIEYLKFINDVCSAADFISIQIILLAVVVTVHTYLGLHVIRRGIVFSDLSLDQLAALGMIIGITVNIPENSVLSYLISFALVLAGAFILAYLKPKDKRVPHEALIGILYGLALAASIIVAYSTLGGMGSVKSSLEGCIGWTTWPLVYMTVIVYVILGVFHYKVKDRIIAITDNAGKGTHGVVRNEKIWDLFFFISLGIITVLIVPIAGVLLAYGFLMIPAATAALFTKRWSSGLGIGWAVGFIASVTGLLAAYFGKLSYGPTLILSMGSFFIIALIIKSIFPKLNFD
jgi:zinc/manganese transport system permease protein